MAKASFIRKNSAFTIVEVLIVVAVIAILAAVVIVSYDSTINQTNETSLKSDLKTASDALELYKFDSEDNRYPSEISAVDISTSGDNQLEYFYDSYRDGFCLSITSPSLEGIQLHVSNTDQSPKDGACEDFAPGLTSEACFAFNSSTGAITSYYNNEGNNSANPACPRDIVIPSSIGGAEVKSLSGFATRGIQSVVIPNTVTSVTGFEQNSIKSLTIPSSVKTINSLAFFRNQISSLSIPPSVTSMGSGAFNSNRLPDSEAFIYSRRADGTEDRSILASYGGLKKSNIVIPNNVKTIGNQAFFYSSIVSVTIPNTVQSIGNSAFSQNSITSITIPGSVTSIGEGVFRYNQLSSVTFSDLWQTPTVTIGNQAFLYNSPLTSVTLPNCSNYTTSGTNRSFDATVTITRGCAPN